MLQVNQLYTVEVRDLDNKIFNVSRSDLETFIRVLVLNDFNNFAVKPWTNPFRINNVVPATHSQSYNEPIERYTQYTHESNESKFRIRDIKWR